MYMSMDIIHLLQQRQSMALYMFFIVRMDGKANHLAVHSLKDVLGMLDKQICL